MEVVTARLGDAVAKFRERKEGLQIAGRVLVAGRKAVPEDVVVRVWA